MSTKLYRNDGKEKLNILGVGELKPGEQISVTTEYQPPVIMANYPGLVDLTDPNFVDTKVESVDEAEVAQPKQINIDKEV